MTTTTHLTNSLRLPRICRVPIIKTTWNSSCSKTTTSQQTKTQGERNRKQLKSSILRPTISTHRLFRWSTMRRPRLSLKMVSLLIGSKSQLGLKTAMKKFQEMMSPMTPKMKTIEIHKTLKTMSARTPMSSRTKCKMKFLQLTSVFQELAQEIKKLMADLLTQVRQQFSFRSKEEAMDPKHQGTTTETCLTRCNSITSSITFVHLALKVWLLLDVETATIRTTKTTSKSPNMEEDSLVLMTCMSQVQARAELLEKLAQATKLSKEGIAEDTDNRTNSQAVEPTIATSIGDPIETTGKEDKTKNWLTLEEVVKTMETYKTMTIHLNKLWMLTTEEDQLERQTEVDSKTFSSNSLSKSRIERHPPISLARSSQWISMLLRVNLPLFKTNLWALAKRGSRKITRIDTVLPEVKMALMLFSRSLATWRITTTKFQTLQRVHRVRWEFTELLDIWISLSQAKWYQHPLLLTAEDSSSSIKVQSAQALPMEVQRRLLEATPG